MKKQMSRTAMSSGTFITTTGGIMTALRQHGGIRENTTFYILEPKKPCLRKVLLKHFVMPHLRASHAQFK